MVTIGAVWDRTTTFLSDQAQTLMPIALGAIYVPLCIQGSIAPLAQNAPPGEAAVLAVARAVLTIWGLWGQLAIIALALAPDAGRATAGGIATRRLVPTIAVGLAIALAVTVLASPMFALLAMGGYDVRAAMTEGQPAMPTGNFAGFAILYGLLLIVILLILAPRVVLSSSAVVAERRWLSAIPRSWALTRGLWLKILGVAALYVIVAGVSQLATQFVFGSIFRLVFGGQGALSLAVVLTAIVTGVVGTGFAVLQSAFLAKLYLAATATRDGAVLA